MDLREYILKQLKELRWSQAELCRQTGIPKPTLASYLRGERGLKDDTGIHNNARYLSKIAMAFDKPLSEVLSVAGVIENFDEVNEDDVFSAHRKAGSVSFSP